jgi:retron-type reverse transcriptase
VPLFLVVRRCKLTRFASSTEKKKEPASTPKGEKQNSREALSRFGHPSAKSVKRGNYVKVSDESKKGLWKQIAHFENLLAAYRLAAKGKRFRDEVLAFSNLLEDNLCGLRDDLIRETYTVGKYREFYINDPKKRLIMALPFRDRVAQWAVCRVLNPIIIKTYIEDSFARIEGRGVHSAVKRVNYSSRV